MPQSVHRSASDPTDPAGAGISAVNPHDEKITSQLASRVGELYAAEERRQRKERTDRIIERAAFSTEE